VLSLNTEEQQNALIPENDSAHLSDQKKSNPKKKFGLAGAATILLVILIVLLYPRPDISFAVKPLPETIEPGEEITIIAEVQNSGRAAGLYQLILYIDEVEAETQEINILPGGKKNVYFKIARALSPGNYQLGLNEWAGEIRVLKPAEFHVENFSLNPVEIQVDQESTVSATISNKGEISGSYIIELIFDGETVLSEEIDLSGNGSKTFSHKLSREEPGQYQVAINEQSKTLKVLRPAETKVSDLTLSATSVKPGQTVVVTAVVSNSGEVAGDHTLSLAVDGKTVENRTITVRENSSENVSFNVSRDYAGRFTVACGGLSKAFTVMKIERPANGTIISRAMGSGEGELRISNGRAQDALVALTGVNSGTPLLAIYVRANSSTTVRNIADRTYDVYFSHGNDWDSHSKRFTANVSHMKFRDSLSFVTTSMQYSIWEITVHAVAGGKAATDYVNPDRFPKF